MKSYGFAAEPFAYGAGSNIIFEVIFHGEITGPEFASATSHLKKPELCVVFDDFVTYDGELRDVERKAEWLSAVYDAAEDSTTVEFAYPIESFDRDGEVTLNEVRLSISPPGDNQRFERDALEGVLRLPYDEDSSAMLHWRPVDDNIFPQQSFAYVPGSVTRKRLEDAGIQVIGFEDAGVRPGASGENPGDAEPYPIRSLSFQHFLRKADDYQPLYPPGERIQGLNYKPLHPPLRSEAPIAQTPPTVQMRRAGGGTGAATGDFNVEITFSGPLSEASAAALASKISVEAIEGGSLSVPQRVRVSRRLMHRRRGRCLSP